MFGRIKKEEIHDYTPYKDLWMSINTLGWAIEAKARHVKTVLAAVEYYPEGADKDAEREELAISQRALMGAIAAYDDSLSELKRMFNTCREQIAESRQKEWNPEQWPTSHEWVRRVVNS